MLEKWVSDWVVDKAAEGKKQRVRDCIGDMTSARTYTKREYLAGLSTMSSTAACLLRHVVGRVFNSSGTILKASLWFGPAERQDQFNNEK